MPEVEKERARSKTGLVGIQGSSQRQPLRLFRPHREDHADKSPTKEPSEGSTPWISPSCAPREPERSQHQPEFPPEVPPATSLTSPMRRRPETPCTLFRLRRSLAGWFAGNGKESSRVVLTPRGLSLTKILSVPVSPAIDDGPRGRSVAQEWLAAQARTFSTAGLGSRLSTFWHSDEVGIWNF